MSQKILLTFDEISVIKSFGELSEASVPQLAVQARLTPTEMAETMAKLQSKSLVKTYKGGHFAKLTALGCMALTNWEFDPQGSSHILMPKSGNSALRPFSGTKAQAEKEIGM